MKKFLFFLTIPFLLFSCGNQEEQDRLQAQIDSLEQITNADASTITEFVQGFNEIQANLDAIKQKEQIISVKTSGDIELDATAKDQINDDVSAIYELMIKNKKQLAYLNKKLKQSGSKSSELQKMVATLTKQLEQKDAELTDLKNHMEELNLEVATLNSAIEGLETGMNELGEVSEEQKEVIAEQDKELNTGYYVFGTSKELKTQEVVTREGGFIGIGRIEKLRENFSKDYFTVVDIRNKTSIALFTKKAEIATTHPSNSYYYAGNDMVDSLVITDPTKFWSVSKYLVIVID